MDPARILIADDDPLMNELLGEQLDLWGYEVDAARGVEEALARLARKPFEAVVSDLHMPPRDGFELLAAVRARWPATAVVLMSAFPAPDTAQRAVDAGAAAFLSKPFLLDQLRGVLERAVPGPGSSALGSPGIDALQPRSATESS